MTRIVVEVEVPPDAEREPWQYMEGMKDWADAEGLIVRRAHVRLDEDELRDD